MTDRELLELAAKAVGYEVVQYHQPARGNGLLAADWGGPWMEVIKPEAPLGACRWNPLTNDADALRLAVKVGASIHPLPDRIIVRYDNPNNPHPFVSLPNGADANEATRRAIVRVVAAIGRSI